MAEAIGDQEEDGAGAEDDQGQQGADEPDGSSLFAGGGLGDAEEVDEAAGDEGENAHIRYLSSVMGLTLKAYIDFPNRRSFDSVWRKMRAKLRAG